MFSRLSARVFLLVSIVLPIAGCSNPLIIGLAVSPSSQSIAVGQTAQFTATGTYGHGNGNKTTQDVSNQVTWTSSVPAVATISASGVATAVASGTTTITASMNGFNGNETSSVTLTVTGSGSGSIAGITSLTVIPGTQTVAVPGQTSQFIAIGTTTAGATVNLTSQVAWSSSSTQIATVNATTGLATAVSQGAVTMTALYTNPGSGNAITGTAAFTVLGGTTQQYTAVTIVPDSQSVSLSGQKGQLIALGTLGSTGLKQDVTNSSQIVWTSSNPSIATVTSGLASGNGITSGASVGTATVTAELKNPDGSVVSNVAAITVTAAQGSLLSLTIIPNSISVGNLQDTGNFIAIGTFSTPPAIRDLTNSVVWLSSFPNVFPVNSNTNSTNPGAPGGIVTAYGSGTAAIIAEATDPTSGSIQTATAEFSCPYIAPNPSSTPPVPGSCYPGSQASALLSTVTVYNEGLNTTNWYITAPSATGTPNVIHCGPGWPGSGGSVCVATYPIGSPLILTAPAGTGAFGGWSSNCTPNPNPPTASGPNTCTIIPTNSNETVGAIFN